MPVGVLQMTSGRATHAGLVEEMQRGSKGHLGCGVSDPNRAASQSKLRECLIQSGRLPGLEGHNVDGHGNESGVFYPF